MGPSPDFCRGKLNERDPSLSLVWLPLVEQLLFFESRQLVRDYRHPFYSDSLIRLVSQDFVVENFGLIDFGINTLHSPVSFVYNMPSSCEGIC